MAKIPRLETRMSSLDLREETIIDPSSEIVGAVKELGGVVGDQIREGIAAKQKMADQTELDRLETELIKYREKQRAEKWDVAETSADLQNFLDEERESRPVESEKLSYDGNVRWMEMQSRYKKSSVEYLDRSIRDVKSFEFEKGHAAKSAAKSQANTGFYRLNPTQQQQGNFEFANESYKDYLIHAGIAGKQRAEKLYTSNLNKYIDETTKSLISAGDYRGAIAQLNHIEQNGLAAGRLNLENKRAALYNKINSHAKSNLAATNNRLKSSNKDATTNPSIRRRKQYAITQLDTLRKNYNKLPYVRDLKDREKLQREMFERGAELLTLRNNQTPYNKATKLTPKKQRIMMDQFKKLLGLKKGESLPADFQEDVVLQRANQYQKQIALDNRKLLATNAWRVERENNPDKSDDEIQSTLHEKGLIGVMDTEELKQALENSDMVDLVAKHSANGTIGGLLRQSATVYDTGEIGDAEGVSSTFVMDIDDAIANKKTATINRKKFPVMTKDLNKKHDSLLIKHKDTITRSSFAKRINPRGQIAKEVAKIGGPYKSLFHDLVRARHYTLLSPMTQGGVGDSSRALNQAKDEAQALLEKQYMIRSGHLLRKYGDETDRRIGPQIVRMKNAIRSKASAQKLLHPKQAALFKRFIWSSGLAEGTDMKLQVVIRSMTTDSSGKQREVEVITDPRAPTGTDELGGVIQFDRDYIMNTDWNNWFYRKN